MSAVDVANRVAALVENLGPNDMGRVRAMIAEAGVQPNMHVGDNPDTFDDRKTAEWWLGSMADIIDKKAWFAMNFLLNWWAGQSSKAAP